MLTSYFRNGGMIGVTLDFNTTERYLVPSGEGGGGTVEFVDVASVQSNGSSADLTIDITGLAQVGDLVLVVAGANISSSGLAAFGISGYTQVANHSFVGTGQEVQMMCGYKFYAGTADDTITISGSLGGFNEGAGAIAHIFRGVDDTNPLDVPVQLSTTPQTVRPTPPPITPVTVGSMVYVAGAAGHGAGSFFYAIPSALDVRGVTGNGSFDFSMSAGRFLAWSSGTVTPSTFLGGTESTAYNSIGLTLALRPANVGGGGSGTVLTYLNNYAQEGSAQNPVTFSGVDFGTEASDRYIIAGYSTRNDTRTINSVTIGGVSATILVQNQNGNTTTGMAMAAVPTGTSGDVVVTLNGTADSHYLGVWSATGLASATPVATAVSNSSGSDAGPQSFTMDTDENGFVIVVDGSAAGGNGPEDPATVSANLTLRYDGVTTTPLHTSGSSAGADGLTDGTTTTFEITIGDTNNNNPAVAATFAGTAGGGTVEGNLKNSGIWDAPAVLASIIAGGSTPSYELGLTASLFTVTGTNDAWTQQTVDISAYAGATVRLVFRYQNGDSFTGDLQLDQIDLDGNVYSFENQTHGFETSSNDDSATYAGVSWSALTVTENLDGYWQVDQGGTPSNGTARTDAADGSYYVYAETSAPANVAGYNFWLRSPEIVLGSSPTLTFFEARNGAGIGTLDVFLEVIA